MQHVRAMLAAMCVTFALFGPSSAAYGDESRTHAVQPGDSLLRIASAQRPERHGVSVEQLAWTIFQQNPGAFAQGPLAAPTLPVVHLPSWALVRATDHATASAALARNGPPDAAMLAASAPVILGVTPDPTPLKPGVQTFTVKGVGFKRGATLSFTNVTNKRHYASRRPSSVTATAITRAANFGQQPAHWQVVVRNPDGQESPPFDFGVGMTIAKAAPAPVKATVPVAVFADSIEAEAIHATLAAGQPVEALRQLAALEPVYAGDPAFDQAYGVAALDSGHAGEAVVALQRVVAQQPGNAGARMDLARAYYELGDHQEARREFTQLQREEPPPAARLVIQRYLEAVDRRASGSEPHLRARLEFATGYDSNANGGTDANSFLGFELTDGTRRTETGFYGVAGDYFYTAPLGVNWRWSSGLRGSHRENPSASFVNNSQIRAATSLIYSREAFSTSLGLSSHWAALDGASNNTGYGVDLASSYGFSQRFYALGNLRAGGLRYVDALNVQDVDQVLGGLSLGWRFAQRLQLEAGPVFGSDEPLAGESPYGRKLSGARAALTAPGLGRLNLAAAIGWLQSDYDGLFFGLRREDQQLNAQIEVDASAFVRPWNLRLHLLYIENQSDIELFAYDRAELGLTLGWGL